MTSKYMPKKDKKLQFKGFISPRYTPIPDEVLDELMYSLSGAELKVLLYICRRTFGFKKESDNISLNQICHGIQKKTGEVLDSGTGLSQRQVIRALKTLTEENIVHAKKNTSLAKGFEPTTYSLNFLDGGNTGHPFRQNVRRVGSKMSEGLLTKSQIQETVLQETVNNTVNGSSKLIKNLVNLNIPNEQVDYIANHILQELGDKHSTKFYKLVSRKIPENVIRQALSEIKVDGAKHPAKVFVYRMKEYAMTEARRGLVKSF